VTLLMMIMIYIYIFVSHAMPIEIFTVNFMIDDTHSTWFFVLRFITIMVILNMPLLMIL
jgi:hypothetical protein